MGKKIFRYLMLIVGVIILLIFCFLTIKYFSFSVITQQVKNLLSEPFILFFMTLSYFSSFVLRAVAWKLYLPTKITFRIYLGALLYSLFINHLLPFKAGEAVRVGVLAKQEEVSLDQSLHSVFVMRLLDMLILACIAIIGGIYFGLSLSYSYFFYFFLAIFIMTSFTFILLKKLKINLYQKHLSIIKGVILSPRGFMIFLLIFVSWLLEAVVIYGVIKATGDEITMLKAVWINSLTVASSIFQFTPGGLGTYESVMSLGLVHFKLDFEQAYSISLITHGYKYVFSFLSGILALILVPIPFSVISSWVKKKGATR